MADGFGMVPEIVALNIEKARWGLPGALEGLSRAREVCRVNGLDRLLQEVDSVAC